MLPNDDGCSDSNKVGSKKGNEEDHEVESDDEVSRQTIFEELILCPAPTSLIRTPDMIS